MFVIIKWRIEKESLNKQAQFTNKWHDHGRKLKETHAQTIKDLTDKLKVAETGAGVPEEMSKEAARLRR